MTRNEKIQSLIDAINEKTHGSDTDITTAVLTIIAGGSDTIIGQSTVTSTADGITATFSASFTPKWVLLFNEKAYSNMRNGEIIWIVLSTRQDIPGMRGTSASMAYKLNDTQSSNGYIFNSVFDSTHFKFSGNEHIAVGDTFSWVVIG